MHKKYIYLSFGLVLIVTIAGLFLDIMAPDGALYASIAKTMSLNNDFINLYSLGNDWLDKPHFPFWITALTFQILGISSFTYKLPAVIFFFFAVWITYKFTKENYTKETAVYAAIILATSLHSVISNFDVRAEPFLTATIIAAVYYFHLYIRQKKLLFLILGSAFAAFSLMTKGMFTLIPIIAALVGELTLKRNWKTLFSPYWLLAIVLVFIFTIPELYSLYQQFDSHPEKIVFGRNNVSGIKFFFWDSQFGRFFNNGPIVKSKGDIFFFLHTILWAFLPWSILFYLATFLKIKRNVKKVSKTEEYYSLFGSLATILVFSLSKFQLAHYTNIVFPFMAIITADFIVKLKEQYKNYIRSYTVIQFFIIAVGIVVIPILAIYMFGSVSVYFITGLLVIAGVSYMVFKDQKLSQINKTFLYSTLSYILLYWFMMTDFYPNLLPYQGGVKAARYVNKNLPEINVIKKELNSDLVYKLYNSKGFEFYTDKKINRVPVKEIKNHKNEIFFINEGQFEWLQKKAVPMEIVEKIDYYPITRLNIKFIDKNTRETQLSNNYIVKIK
ncbi:glycosyltransferase family 39 protein [Tenacibaculum sp. SG-28]|uniref:ArnT family glycosyltransferase n=1 Tax=Tenacibaculum sp. SG-28 TaxID=754426 RepID=UPI000CF45C1E|nr:glycosyltransferase family 39 protein [Tenacibaculum sp. SG-28]PQJ19673.1 hypothetical protein BSU00_11900 [Tenacibaculum sp. SG-28]